MKPCHSLIVLLLGIVPAQAADITIRVSSSDGEPLPDAVVALRQPGLESMSQPEAVMDQRDRQFAPYVLAVADGSTVRFPNSDDIRHHVYSFSPAKSFELKLYAGSTADPVTFDQPGLVTLGCNIHDWMLAFIYVTDAPRFAVTDSRGEAVFTGLAEAPLEIEAWQPRLLDGRHPLRRELVAPVDTEILMEVGPELRREPDDTPTRSRRRR